MAFAIDKQLKEFMANFQKDLATLQKTIMKESDDLVTKVKTAAQKDNLQAKRKEIEQIVEKNLKKYEPTINRFVHDLNKNAKKAGVDLTQLEKKVRSNLATARKKLTEKVEDTRSTVKKAAGANGKAKPKTTAAQQKARKPAVAGAKKAKKAPGVTATRESAAADTETMAGDE
jgi:hypothetical protein